MDKPRTSPLLQYAEMLRRHFDVVTSHMPGFGNPWYAEATHRCITLYSTLTFDTRTGHGIRNAPFLVRFDIHKHEMNVSMYRGPDGTATVSAMSKKYGLRDKIYNVLEVVHEDLVRDGLHEASLGPLNINHPLPEGLRYDADQRIGQAASKSRT